MGQNRPSYTDKIKREGRKLVRMLGEVGREILNGNSGKRGQEIHVNVTYKKGNRRNGGGRQSEVGSSSASGRGEKREEREKEERGEGEKNRWRRTREVVAEDEKTIRVRDGGSASGESGAAGDDRTDGRTNQRGYEKKRGRGGVGAEAKKRGMVE